MKAPLTSIIKSVQYALRQRALYHGDIDGIAGVQTWPAIATALGAPDPANFDPKLAPATPAKEVPQRAIDLILEAEGVDQPWRWPGGDSGITIGRGYDLGYEQNFTRDWAEELTGAQIDLLESAVGLRGDSCQLLANRFLHITITREQADRVFHNVTLPQYAAETIAAFPGAERLPALVFGALVSLVFNRGTGMVGPTRAEMRAVRDAVAIGDLEEIARQIRAMKHLWAGKDLDGLLVRREAEASLVEEAMA